MRIEDKYKYVTITDSIKHKDWAAGSRIPIDKTEIIATGRPLNARFETLRYPPALLKIVDEPIVNAIDHYVRQADTSSPVTDIRVAIDSAGQISVRNDGPGIEIEIHKDASAALSQQIYIPALLFGFAFQGSNFEADKTSIVGGTNGLGAKVTNCFSSRFVVTTVRDKKRFTQTWTNGMSSTTGATIADCSEDDYTELAFVPDYAHFSFKSPEEAVAVMTPLIETRMHFAAAYMRYTGAKHLRVSFNGKAILTKSLNEIASALFGAERTRSAIISQTTKYPWEVTVVVCKKQPLVAQSGSVNGIVVKDGKHYKKIANSIVAKAHMAINGSLATDMAKVSKAVIASSLFVMVNAKIPQPSWSGQCKDVLEIDTAKLSEYNLTDQFINRVVADLGALVVPKQKKQQKKQVEFDKYKPAQLAGSAKSADCSLLLTEGDSAMSQMSNLVGQTLGWQRYGIMSLGGVIINVRRECEIVRQGASQQVKSMTKKLRENKFFANLLAIIGLSTSRCYETADEMKTLNYGHVVACVDQDYDGKGKILSLVLNIFDYLWPNLISNGFVQWFCTPIIRAYPKRGGEVEQFYSKPEFERWCARSNVSTYDIRYYKGLGSHDRDEGLSMMKKYATGMRLTFVRDSSASVCFDRYLGADSSKRKEALVTPPVTPSPEAIDKQWKTKQINCSDYMELEVKEYQLDDIDRKLISYIDGQNQAGRKILDGCLRCLRDGTVKKIAQVTGFIIENENYEHGEASLGASIMTRGFLAVGGLQLPILVPHGQFGTRACGGAGAVAPRYAKISLNANIMNLIYPADDYTLLSFNFDDGDRNEPKYFVPIIPMATIESVSMPGHGWKIETWARDVFDVLRNVRRLIKLDGQEPPVLLPMKPSRNRGSLYEWHGEFVSFAGDTYSVGTYSLSHDGKLLKITELPLRVWTNNYCDDLRAKRDRDGYIKSITDASTDTSISITVKLNEGSIDAITELAQGPFDGVLIYFGLRVKMNSHINMIADTGAVRSFSSYEDIVVAWYSHRKKLYARRVEYKRKLTALRELLLQNKIRYIESTSELGLAKRPLAEMVKTLENNNYTRIWASKLDNPGFTPIDSLDNEILHGTGANYDYLLKLSDTKKSNESLCKLKDDLNRLKCDETRENERFIGETLWCRELDELERQIRRGLETNWLYDKYGKYSL